MTKKVIVIGNGYVGAATTHALVARGIGEEIGLLDINEEKAFADALDFTHALPYLETDTKRVFQGTYEDVADAQVVVLAIHVKGTQLVQEVGRNVFLHSNSKVAIDVARKIKESGFSGVIVVVTNPVDTITQLVAQETGFPKERIIGTGTMLETARMKTFVAEHFHVSPKDVDGFVLGEHGATAFTCWSSLKVNGKVVADELDCDKIDQQVKDVAFKIYNVKGEVSYSIGNVTARLVKGIIDDEGAVLPVSTFVAELGIYVGVPAVIDKSGVRELFSIELSENEREKLQKSALVLGQNLKEVF